jgi:hypothetical protein
MDIREWSLKYRIFKGILHKDKVHPRTDNEGPEREKIYKQSSITSALDGGGRSTPRASRFNPGKYPVPIV